MTSTESDPGELSSRPSPRSAPGSTPSVPPPPTSRAGYRSAKTRYFWSPERAVGRFVLSAMLGFVAMLLTPAGTAWQLRSMVGWDMTALALLALTWRILLGSDARTTELRAGDEDPGGRAVFVIAVLSSVFSLFAATLVLRMLRGQSCGQLWVVLALVSVALSWIVTHTAFTFRYAHLYYTGTVNGGLLFPGTATPCDLDFAYYSFTLGMCFQVSDVQITDSEIRRTTLAHALVSFVFNTTILALSLNLMFQLLGG